MRNRKRTGWHKIINGVNVATFFVVLFIGLPLYWLIASSFKTPETSASTRRSTSRTR